MPNEWLVEPFRTWAANLGAKPGSKLHNEWKRNIVAANLRLFHPKFQIDCDIAKGKDGPPIDYDRLMPCCVVRQDKSFSVGRWQLNAVSSDVF